jgi:3',5'-cyclic AMP phosphodiesterase CpdA
MPVRIAHISDLHYGARGFDIARWNQAKRVVVEFLKFGPGLIVVSGDLVDQPILGHLETAKRELDGLARDARVPMFVVPGNHDLFEAGNNIGQGRLSSYDKVFNSAAGAGDIPHPNVHGFAPSPRGWRAAIAGPMRAMRERFGAAPQVPTPTPISAPATPTLIQQPNGIPVLLALLDSNAADQRIGLATGSISSDHLQALDGELNANTTPHLLRIAVIHHHVLPIAYTAGGLVGAEPFMVLHNAGDLLAVLARHHFDLVLHGHKHRAQFARIDFAPDSAAGYPIAVAAAGSATLRHSNAPCGNNFNLITVHDNGRIVVESLHYGQGVAPQLNASVGDALTRYTEPVESVKHRAFIRARQRHRVICDRREVFFDVNASGDLHVTHRVSSLRLLRGNQPYRRCRHDVVMSQHGRLVLDLELDVESSESGYKIERQDAGNGLTRRRVVVLPESLGNGDPANYTVRHACANSMMMTRWEAEERARANADNEDRPGGWDEEWVGTIVKAPVEEIVLEVVLPESLGSAKPYVRCERPRAFPAYDIDSVTDDVQVTPQTQWDLDDEMRNEEARHLSYVPEKGCWRLVVRRPLVSYRYRLRWRLPGAQPHEPIPIAGPSSGGSG